MLTKTRTDVNTSLDGDGWTVRIGESRWRFNKYEFALQFSLQMLNEDFAGLIIDHAHNHVWDLCKPDFCRGALWQIIQGIE
jgi:hypothetical protein